MTEVLTKEAFDSQTALLHCRGELKDPELGL